VVGRGELVVSRVCGPLNRLRTHVSALRGTPVLGLELGHSPARSGWLHDDVPSQGHFSGLVRHDPRCRISWVIQERAVPRLRTTLSR
jgi:hypothetical protein